MAKIGLIIGDPGDDKTLSITCDASGLRRVEYLFGKGSALANAIQEQIHTEAAKRFADILYEIIHGEPAPSRGVYFVRADS